MKRKWGWGTIVAAVLVLVVLAAFLWRLLAKPSGEAQAAAPVAAVTVAPVAAGEISRTVEAYGVIAGSAAATRTVAAPREVIVRDLLVGPGQPVAAGAPLVAVGDTPTSAQVFRQAADADAFARADLARVQRLWAQRLAANDQLVAAKKALADADAALAAQKAAGGGRTRQIIASPIAGVVAQVSAARGAQMPAGSPLVSVVASGGLVAQLGVEPQSAALLATGQPVRIVSALDPGRSLVSRLAIVGGAIDPATRLISVTAPAEGAGLTLGAAVKGEITIATAPGLTVPRAAVVYDEKGAHVFVVRGGKAVEVPVAPGPASGDSIGVAGALRAGEPVVVAGAYQVEDGGAVRVVAR